MLGSAIGLAALQPTNANAASRKPDDMVRESVNEVIAILRTTNPESEERRRLIERVATTFFDLDEIADYVLGRRIELFSEKQRDEYRREFKTYLAHRYGHKLSGYDNEEVEIKDTRLGKPGHVKVMTHVVGDKGEKMRISFELAEKGSRWLAVEIEVDGVAIVENLKAQCMSVIDRKGVESLLARLREINASFEPEDVDPATAE
jgi:phospholipid transport system substrate-binding protein